MTDATPSLFHHGRTTERGFRVYAETEDVYGAEVSIVESSSATQSQIWLQIEPTDHDQASRTGDSILFTVRQARQFALALLQACEEQGE